MTHTFEIKVQCKGNAVGTLAWLDSFLANGELVIKNTKSGTAGMFFHTKLKDDGTPNADNEGNTFICKAVSNTYQYEGHRSVYVNDKTSIIFPHVISDPYGRDEGIFTFPLTPSATVKMEEFISNAVEEFIAWWENQ